MKLLFDENLSHRLPVRLADIFPDSEHVRNLSLNSSSDTEVWEYAKLNGFAIVSKDSDFHQRSLLLGNPPKVIWIRIGNCSTTQIEQVLRDHVDIVAQFESDPGSAFLILS
jgi:predicted nuclease of predicted toxin-antitoxin system